MGQVPHCQECPPGETVPYAQPTLGSEEGVSPGGWHLCLGGCSLLRVFINHWVFISADAWISLESSTTASSCSNQPCSHRLWQGTVLPVGSSVLCHHGDGSTFWSPFLVSYFLTQQGAPGSLCRPPRLVLAPAISAGAQVLIWKQAPCSLGCGSHTLPAERMRTWI